MIPLRVILHCLEGRIVIYWGDSSANFISCDSVPYTADQYGSLIGQIDQPIVCLFSDRLVIQTENPIIYPIGA